MADDEEVIEVPRDYFIRAVYPGAGVSEDKRPVMRGHLAVFNEWGVIDSRVEGQFMERIAPNSFKKTITDQRSRMRVIYDHGQDSQYGRHPLGPIQDLREDERGVYYEVPLLDNNRSRDLIPGLREGLYGASFRFRPTKRPTVFRPKEPSAHNPDMWEERTVTELEMTEFGPTPFPVYDGPTAGMRSMTDEYRGLQLGLDPETIRELLHSQKSEPPQGTPVTEAAPYVPRFRNREEYLAWISTI